MKSVAKGELLLSSFGNRIMKAFVKINLQLLFTSVYNITQHSTVQIVASSNQQRSNGQFTQETVTL